MANHLCIGLWESVRRYCSQLGLECRSNKKVNSSCFSCPIGNWYSFYGVRVGNSSLWKESIVNVFGSLHPPPSVNSNNKQARKDIVEGSLSASRLKGSTRLTPRELAFRFASDLAFIPPSLPGLDFALLSAMLAYDEGLSFWLCRGYPMVWAVISRAWLGSSCWSILAQRLK